MWTDKETKVATKECKKAKALSGEGNCGAGNDDMMDDEGKPMKKGDKDGDEKPAPERRILEETGEFVEDDTNGVNAWIEDAE